MARNTTRVGRRRRVLNEEVLSASNIAVRFGSSSQGIEPADTPRYGAGANIENHPQVTSFVPRRFRTLSLIALLGLGVGATAELTSYYAQSLSRLAQVVSPAEFTEVFANRLVAWTSATILLAAAAYARLIFSLRRHRVDDYRGLYRVWRTAGYAALVLSINSVLGAHQLVARSLGHLIDYQLLPDSAGWWLAPALIFGGWLVIKLVVDASECRSAMAVYLLAIACLTMAGVHSAGWSPTWSESWPGLLGRALPLGGFTLLLLGSQLFARYVVLDVQGLICHRSTNPSTNSGKDEPHIDTEVAPVREAVAEPQTSEWVDGSEPEADHDDSGGPRSKSERKRIRKQKQRRAA